MILFFAFLGLLTGALLLAFLRLMDPFRSFPLHWLALIAGVTFPLSLWVQTALLGRVGDWLAMASKYDTYWMWLIAFAAAGALLFLQLILFAAFTTVFKSRHNPVVFLQVMGAISIGTGLGALWLLCEKYPLFWEGGLVIVAVAGQILWGQLIAYGWMSIKLVKAKLQGVLFGLLGIVLNLIWMALWYWIPPTITAVVIMGFLFFLLLSLLPQMFNNALNFSPRFDQRKGMDFVRITGYLVGGLFVWGGVIFAYSNLREVGLIEKRLEGVNLWSSMFVMGFTFLRWPKMRLVPKHWEYIRFQLIFSAWEGMKAPEVFGGLPHGMPHITPLPQDSRTQLRISGPHMNEAYLDSLIGERAMLVPLSKRKKGTTQPVWVKVLGKQFIGKDSSVYRAEVEVEGEAAKSSPIWYLIPRYKRKRTKNDHYFMGILIPNGEVDLSATFLESSQFRFRSWVVLYDEAEIEKRIKERQ